MTDNSFNRGPDYQEVSLEDFVGLDRGFYLETAGYFESEGFVHVGDLENLTESRSHPSRRTCIRLLVDDTGTIQAAVYQIPPAGIVAILLVATSLKFVELETELTDGAFLVTTNNGLGESPRRVDKLVEMEAAPEKILELHRERVQSYLEDNPGIQVRLRRSLGDVLEAQQRRHQEISGVDQQRLRKRRSQKQGRWISGILPDIYEYRVAITSVVAWILIGLAVGSLMRFAQSRKIEQARRLTLEKYEQGFEEARAREGRPSSLLWSWCVLMLLGGLFFALYEVLRRKLRSGLTWLLRRERERAPPASGFHVSSSARYAPFGKVLAIVALSLLAAYGSLRFGSGRNGDTSTLTKEQYLARFEAQQEEAGRPSGNNHLVAGLVFSGFLIVLYEFGGGTAAVALAAVTGGTVSMGNHVFLANFGPLVLFLGGALSFVAVLHFLQEFWPDTSFGWTAVPALILGAILYNMTWARWLATIPVPCRRCNGKAYFTSTKPTTFECRDCRYVHRVQ